MDPPVWLRLSQSRLPCSETGRAALRSVMFGEFDEKFYGKDSAGALEAENAQTVGGWSGAEKGSPRGPCGPRMVFGGDDILGFVLHKEPVRHIGK